MLKIFKIVGSKVKVINKEIMYEKNGWDIPTMTGKNDHFEVGWKEYHLAGDFDATKCLLIDDDELGKVHNCAHFVKEGIRGKSIRIKHSPVGASGPPSEPDGAAEDAAAAKLTTTLSAPLEALSAR